MSALVVIGIALVFVVDGGGKGSDRQGNPVHLHAPAAWIYFVIVLIGLIAAVVVQFLGYRLPAISPNADPAEARRTGLQAYQQAMLLRFAISEVVAIISIALLFSSKSNTILPYVVGAVISLVLMGYHVWPSDALINRVQERLDRNGGHSDLANAMNGAS
jgi:hypothetical protein